MSKSQYIRNKSIKRHHSKRVEKTEVRLNINVQAPDSNLLTERYLDSYCVDYHRSKENFVFVKKPLLPASLLNDLEYRRRNFYFPNKHDTGYMWFKFKRWIRDFHVSKYVKEWIKYPREPIDWADDYDAVDLVDSAIAKLEILIDVEKAHKKLEIDYSTELVPEMNLAPQFNLRGKSRHWFTLLMLATGVVPATKFPVFSHDWSSDNVEKWSIAPSAIQEGPY